MAVLVCIPTNVNIGCFPSTSSLTSVIRFVDDSHSDWDEYYHEAVLTHLPGG